MAEPITRFEGVLFFPVTPFDERGAVDPGLLRQHIETRLDYRPGAVFAACGTGEFHALSLSEYELVVATAVKATAGRTTVVAGTGGPLGHARDCAAAAQRSGADALLVMPPYLVNGPQAGIVAYVEAIAQASELPLIVYHRGTAQFSAESFTRLLGNPKVIGIKDGVGDIAVAQELVLAAEASGREDILFFNGLLTAELSQAAYRAIGIPLYSSAVFAMEPGIATAFYAAYRDNDEARRLELLGGFYAPLVRLRDQTPGFAVSLIKAGLRLAGLPVGSVRPPLVDPSEAQEAELARILERGRSLV